MLLPSDALMLSDALALPSDLPTLPNTFLSDALTMPQVWAPGATLPQWVAFIAVVLTVWGGHFLFVRSPHAIKKATALRAQNYLKRMAAMLAYAEADAKRPSGDRNPPEAARLLDLLWDDAREVRTFAYGFDAAYHLNARCEALYRETWEAEVRKALRLTSAALADVPPPDSHQKELDEHRSGTRLLAMLRTNDKVCKDLGDSFGIDKALATEARRAVRNAYSAAGGGWRLLYGMLRPSLPTIIYSILIDVLITAFRAYFHQLGTWMACIEAGVRGDMQLAEALLWDQWLGHMLIKILEVPASTYTKRCRSVFGNEVRNGVLKAMVGQDYEYFERNDSGVLQERLNRDADELGENLVEFPKRMFERLTWILANLYLVWRQAPPSFFSVACLPVLCMIVFQYFSFRYFRRCDELARKVEEEGISQTSEVLRQIKTVRQFSSERAAAAAYAGER